jgi:hypothetical protein
VSEARLIRLLARGARKTPRGLPILGARRQSRLGRQVETSSLRPSRKASGRSKRWSPKARSFAADERLAEVREKATGTWDKLEKVFEDRVARALHALNVRAATGVRTGRKPSKSAATRG